MKRVVNEPKGPNQPKLIGSVELDGGNELRAFDCGQPGKLELRHYWLCAPDVLSWSSNSFVVAASDLPEMAHLFERLWKR